MPRHIRWPKVKPCPNCGGQPIRYNGMTNDDGTPLGPYSVECCPLLPPHVEHDHVNMVFGNSPKEAAKKWNDMPLQPPILLHAARQADYERAPSDRSDGASLAAADGHKTRLS